MPALVKVWDAGDEDSPDDFKPGFIDMFAIKAREAVKNDPERYSYEQPAAPRVKKAAKADHDDPKHPPKKGKGDKED
jgi:hypothetical protein